MPRDIEGARPPTFEISFTGIGLRTTQGHYLRAAPCLGKHNRYVYSELLGMSEAEIESYNEQGMFYSRMRCSGTPGAERILPSGVRRREKG